MSCRFKTERDLPAEFQRVAIENLDTAIDRLKAGKVHATRTALKRLRALLRLAPRGDLTAVSEQEALRDAGRALSKSRDIAVCIATLEKIEVRWLKKHPFGLLREAREIIGEPSLLEPSESARVVNRMECTRAVLEKWRPDSTWRSTRQTLRRSYRRSRRAFEEACSAKNDSGGRTLHDARAMHTLRKRVKTLWAQLRILRECSPHVKHWISATEKLGERLGDGHDLVILQTELNRGGGRLAPLPMFLDRLRAACDRKALQLAGEVLGEKPAEFEKRVFRKSRAKDAKHAKERNGRHLNRVKTSPASRGQDEQDSQDVSF